MAEFSFLCAFNYSELILIVVGFLHIYSKIYK